MEEGREEGKREMELEEGEGARGKEGRRERERDGADLFNPKQGCRCSQRIRFVGRQGDDPSLADMVVPAEIYVQYNSTGILSNSILNWQVTIAIIVHHIFL